VSLADQMAAW
jgi:hypothetical protein